MSYDPSGRLLSKGMAFSTAGYSVSRTVKQTYLLGGLPDRTSYGDQILSAETTSTMAYDARGLPASVTISTGGGAVPQPPIVETRNVAGLVTKRRVDYSGGLFVTPAMTYAESVWTYDQLGRVTDQTVNRSPGTPIQVARQALTYLDNDDVATLTTYFGATAKSQTFTYDYRHQLTNVESGTPGYFHADYSYGDAGRFTRATVSQTIVPTPAESEVRARDVFYKYEGTDPEQVTSLRTGSLTGPALITYTYDTSGNQVTRTDAGSGYTWTYLYDGADRLRRATKTQAGVIVGSEEYWYDASGARSQVVKRNAGGNISEMVFFIDGTEVHYTAIGGVTHAYAHVAMGTPIARTDRTLSFLSGETIATEYQFHGLAGSTLTTISSTGTINATFNYGPFGEVLETTNDGGASAGTAVHSRRFNDKQQDDLTGLSYYGARYYDRTLMGWTQLDPLYLRIPDLAKRSTPRRSNLGTFSLNNPVRYVDPDGRDSTLNPAARGKPMSLCQQDSSGHCTHEGDGAAAYDGERAWLSSNTARDKSKRGAERAAAYLAGYNVGRRMSGPGLRTVEVGQTIVQGGAEIVEPILPLVEELPLIGPEVEEIEGEVAAIEAEVDGVVDTVETKAAEAIDALFESEPGLFEWGECHACANAMSNVLQESGIAHELLYLQANGGQPYIWSDLLGRAITTDGTHSAIRVGSVIFDNLTRAGVDAITYFGSGAMSPFGISVTTTPVP